MIEGLSYNGRMRVKLLFPVGILFVLASLATAQSDPVRPGSRFPAGTFPLFNPQGAAEAGEIDLADHLGKKPVLFYYWIPGNRRAEAVLDEILQRVKPSGDKISVVLAAVPNESFGLTADVIRAKIEARGLALPVIDDTGFELGGRLGVRSVPNIALVDAEGRLRLANGASLRQVLAYKLDLGGAIEKLAETGELISYGYLDRYFPVKELEGSRAPDFSAATLDDSTARSFETLIDEGKVNVLIFWSVNCGHCRKSLPEISRWLREHPEGVNVLSCATAPTATTRAKTKEFCDTNDLAFPTLIDEDAKIAELYNVTSTPTILIIGPDGVVDTAVTSSYSSFGEIIERKKRELL